MGVGLVTWEYLRSLRAEQIKKAKEKQKENELRALAYEERQVLPALTSFLECVTAAAYANRCRIEGSHSRFEFETRCARNEIRKSFIKETILKIHKSLKSDSFPF